MMLDSLPISPQSEGDRFVVLIQELVPERMSKHEEGFLLLVHTLVLSLR
jgi:hypothetical protein